MSDVDELFDLKNAFYTGNYSQCIKEAQRMRPSSADVAVLRDVYLYRSYLGQKKFGLVEEEIGGGADERVKPIKTLAKYLRYGSLFCWFIVFGTLLLPKAENETVLPCKGI